MADGTKIEWADATLNYANGCSRVSPGCGGPGPHGGCYAELLAGTRMRNHPTRAGLTKQTPAGPRWTGDVRIHEPALEQALRWKRGRKIFWNAHGDLFHEKVTDEQIDRLFAVCALTPHHTHMILTKRSARMQEYLSRPGVEIGIGICALGFVLDAMVKDPSTNLGAGVLVRSTDHLAGALVTWPLKNVWLGVSVEDQERRSRIADLAQTPAAVRFVSGEPLLEGLSLTDIPLNGGVDEHGIQWLFDALSGEQYFLSEDGFKYSGGGPDMQPVDWLIVGGESGSKARPMHPDWARLLRDQCQAARVPFLLKQWGEWSPICEMSDASIDACYYPAPERDPEARRRLKVDQCVLHGDGSRFDGNAMFEQGAFQQGSGAMTMMRIGKKAAGRMLDGREWSEFPADG